MQRPPTFALLGAAGFVAPRHMRAIHEVGGKLVLACDPHDSVGVLDQHHAWDAAFMEAEDDFWAAVAKKQPDYVVICTPNDLHADHVSMALLHGCKVICEKPLATLSSDVHEMLTGWGARPQDVNVILQLRHDARWQELRRSVQPFVLADLPGSGLHGKLRVEYVTPRGKWYHSSWKGQPKRSGGLLLNIGVHLFDALTWCFDSQPDVVELHENGPEMAVGRLCFGAVQVDWRLSVRFDGQEARRHVSGELGDSRRKQVVSIDLGAGRSDLHTVAYREILAGRGWKPADALPAVELVERLQGR